MVRSDWGARFAKIVWVLGILAVLVVTAIYLWSPAGNLGSRLDTLQERIQMQIHGGDPSPLTDFFQAMWLALMGGLNEVFLNHLGFLFAALGFLCLGGFILWKFPRKLHSRLLVLFCAAAAVYLWSAAYLFTPQDLSPTLYWIFHSLRLGSYSLVYAALFHLVLIFPGQKGLFNRPSLSLLALIYMLGWLPSVLLLLLPDLATGMVWSQQAARILAAFQLGGMVGILIYKVFILRRSMIYAMAHAQLRWLLFGSILSAAVGALSFRLLRDASVPYADFFPQIFSLVPIEVGILFLLFIPLLIAVMIPRYRLLNIDFIISRSLVYILLALIGGFIHLVLSFVLTLAGIYFPLLQSLLPLNILPVFAAVLAAVWFRPSIYHWVDLTFYPEKVVFQNILPEVTAQTLATVDIAQISQILTHDAPHQLQITGASLLVLNHDGKQFNYWGSSHGAEIASDHPLISHLIQHNAPLLRFIKESELSSKANAYLQKYHIELCLPLFVENRLIGVYHLGVKLSGLPYTREEVSLFDKPRQFIAIALDNARTYSRAEGFCQNLEDRLRDMTVEMERVQAGAQGHLGGTQRLGDVQAGSLVLKPDIQTQKLFLDNFKRETHDTISIITDLTQQMLDMPLNQPMQMALVMGVRSHTERLFTTVANLTDYLAIESGKLSLDLRPSSLSEIIQTIHQQTLPKIAQKRLALSCSIEAHCPQILIIDPERLSQIFYHLIDNAIKFTDQGRITIEVSAHASTQLAFSPHLQGNERVYVLQGVVRDTGKGINREQIEQLLLGRSVSSYLPSTGSAHLTTAGHPEDIRTQGVGLGLLISKRLCEMMGGSLWTETSEMAGVGSTFVFTILAQAPEDTFPVFMATDNPLMKEKRALVLLENENERNILGSQLQSWGVQVNYETTREGCIKRLHHPGKMDLLFLDSHLLDGNPVNPSNPHRLRLLELVKKMQETLNPPLVIVGNTSDPTSPYNYVITRPIKTEQLFNLLCRLLSEKAVWEMQDQAGVVGDDASPSQDSPQLDSLVSEPAVQPPDQPFPAQQSRKVAKSTASPVRDMIPTQPLARSDAKPAQGKGVNPGNVGHAVGQAVGQALVEYSSQMPTGIPFVLDESVLQKLVISYGEEGDNKLRRLMITFQADAEQLLKAITQAVNDGQIDSLLHSVRVLKENSAALGAGRLSAAAGEMELCAQQNNIARAAELLPWLREEYDKVQDKITGSKI